MGRLADAGLIGIVWKEESDGTIFADGLQYYEIDNNNELAIFQDDKCVAVHHCVSVEHAASIAEASEHVCRWNIHLGSDWHGHKINERGWRV